MRWLFHDHECSLVTLLEAVLWCLYFCPCCALAAPGTPGLRALPTASALAIAHCAWAGASCPRVGGGCQSLRSTGQWPGQEVHVEFGSEESDLLRNGDTCLEPFIPFIQPLWPIGCPAGSKLQRQHAQSFFIVLGNCANLFHVFIILNLTQRQNGSPEVMDMVMLEQDQKVVVVLHGCLSLCHHFSVWYEHLRKQKKLRIGVIS